MSLKEGKADDDGFHSASYARLAWHQALTIDGGLR
jgi:hypothetical protein